MTATARADRGLQPERTELAWRRTSLAIGAGALIALRLLPGIASDTALQTLLLSPGLAGLIFAYGLWVATRRRSRRWEQALRDPSPGSAPSGGLQAILSGFVLTVGCGALVVVFLVK